jgi:CRP/FNR family transcriptional regulator, cyclic AMP receptor protein
LEETSDALRRQTLAGPLRLQLAADTVALREKIGPQPIRVDHFPFVVGREAQRGEKIPKRLPDLLLQDHQPCRISRQHFMVATSPTGLVVRDLNSSLGTSVNGQPIGSHFRSDIAELRPGQNQIIAGGSDSDFAFTALVH